MANEKPPVGDANSGQSALERYLAKQKKDRAVGRSPEAKAPVSGAATSEARSGVRSQFKYTNDPLSIPRPPAEPSEQPPDLGRWERVAEETVNHVERDSQVRFEKSEVAPESALAVRPSGEFGTRLLAAIVDSMIVGAFSYPARMVVTAVLALSFGPIVDRHADGLSTLIGAAIAYAYYGYFYSQKGASPGKMLLNLEVIDSETGGRLTPWKAFFRETIGKMISAIPFFMGYFIVLVREDRRALHDLLFDTQVVVKNQNR